MIRIGVDIDYTKGIETFAYCVYKFDGEEPAFFIASDVIVNKNVYLDNLPSKKYIKAFKILYPEAQIIIENN